MERLPLIPSTKVFPFIVKLLPFNDRLFELMYKLGVLNSIILLTIFVILELISNNLALNTVFPVKTIFAASIPIPFPEIFACSKTKFAVWLLVNAIELEFKIKLLLLTLKLLEVIMPILL